MFAIINTKHLFLLLLLHLKSKLLQLNETCISEMHLRLNMFSVCSIFLSPQEKPDINSNITLASNVDYTNIIERCANESALFNIFDNDVLGDSSPVTSDR